MPEYKLADVAKKINITPEEILKKFSGKVTDIDSKVSVEQLREAGIDMKKFDKRPENFRQRIIQDVKSRHKYGAVGKEFRVGETNQREQPRSVVTTNPQDLQMRKSALNKTIQQVDEMRQTSRKAKTGKPEGLNVENAEKLFTNEAEIESVKPDAEKLAETVSVSTERTPVFQADTLPPQVQKEEARTESKPPVKTESVQAGAQNRRWQAAKPAEQRERDNRRTYEQRPQDNRKPPQRQDKPTRPGGQPAFRSDNRTDSRPSGTRYDRNKPASGTRPAFGTSRPANQPYGSRPPQRGDRPQPKTYDGKTERPGYRPNARPAAFPETAVKRDVKKTRTEPAGKDDAKKPKTKTDSLSLKDLNKTIHEGMNELNIEAEIGAVVAENETEAAAIPKTVKYDRRSKKKQAEKEYPPAFQRPSSVIIGESVTVTEMAGLLGIKAGELVKKLFSLGVLATVNQSIDADTAALLAIDYGVEIVKKVVTEDDLFPHYVDDLAEMQKRPPVVTVMGHVDHGKTSLLDAIRSTSVAEKEAGGITQHIGAYEVNLKGRKITFLDTPGHEAFTSLRARGAQVTDIVILVVAANDGVMPQTKEAIDHALAAGVCIVVAVNKIDRPDANPDMVKRQLSEYGILSDEWGGRYQFQEISAKKRTGITELLERVLLEADMLELRGNPNRPAEAIVIESQLDKQRGPVATLLVKKGTLHKGDSFVVGKDIGRVRSMYNHLRAVQKEAGISAPVEVMGFSEVPEPGDTLVVVDEKIAKAIADLRAGSAKFTKTSSAPIVSLTDLMDKIKEGKIKELNIIIKADVQGSLEALKSSLIKLSNQEVKVSIVHDATGGITESDVVLALASKAVIIGFNVRPDANAKLRAEREKISVELYSVIYKAIEDVKLALEGLLTPETVEQTVGRVEVRQVFSVPKIGKIAGAYVLEGKVTRSSNVRVIRDNVVVFDGKIGSLKRFSDDVKEVAGGYECGLSVEKYQDIKEKDILEVYELIQEKRTLNDVAK
jgi:translation initiation factor IF-2